MQWSQIVIIIVWSYVCVCLSFVAFFPAIFYFAEFAIAIFFATGYHHHSCIFICIRIIYDRATDIVVTHVYHAAYLKPTDDNGGSGGGDDCTALNFPLIVKPPFVRARQRSNRTNALYNFTTTKTPNKPIVYGTAYQSHLNAFQTH